MTSWITIAALFAEAAADPAKGQENGGGFNTMLPMLVLMGVAFYFLILRPQQKEQAKKQDLLKALKKNDKVVTIGGMIGTIAAIEPDSDEVTIKVDDNTRIRFRRASIQQVITKDEEAEKS